MKVLHKLKFFVIAGLAAFYLLPLPTLAATIDCSNPATLSTEDAIQCGTDTTAGVPQSANAGKKIDTTVQNLLNVLSIAVGILAVIMLIVGGFRFITSSGNPETIKSAKNTITYALIGLVIVALAQIIVNFVLNKATQPPPSSMMITTKDA